MKEKQLTNNILIKSDKHGIYVGTVIDGLENGIGVKKYKSGNKYVGSWLNGKKHGFGKEITNDWYFEGYYKNGHRDGVGKINFENSQISGVWKRGKRHGTFICKSKHYKYTTQFQNDTLSGPTVYVNNDNIVIIYYNNEVEYKRQKGSIADILHTPNDVQLIEENRRLKNGNNFKCKVCYTNPLEIIFKPCNHLCVCGDCVKLLEKNQCIICRVNITDAERVFI